MKVSVALDTLNRMPYHGDLYVKDRDGRWHYVTDMRVSGLDTITPPTTVLFDGVVYVRADRKREEAMKDRRQSGAA